jgi:hypothetical protein
LQRTSTHLYVPIAVARPVLRLRNLGSHNHWSLASDITSGISLVEKKIPNQRSQPTQNTNRSNTGETWNYAVSRIPVLGGSTATDVSAKRPLRYESSLCTVGHFRATDRHLVGDHAFEFMATVVASLPKIPLRANR